MTRRGRAVAYLLAAVLAFSAGATAQYWDPYTHRLDAVTVHLSTPVEEDEAVCVTGSEVAFDRNADGSADIACQFRR